MVYYMYVLHTTFIKRNNTKLKIGVTSRFLFLYFSPSNLLASLTIWANSSGLRNDNTTSKIEKNKKKIFAWTGT